MLSYSQYQKLVKTVRFAVVGRNGLGPAVDEKLGDDPFVGQGGRVADVPVINGYFAQDAPHDFARAGFGQVRGVLDFVGGGERSYLVPDSLFQLLDEDVVEFVGFVHRHEAVEAFSFDWMRFRNHGGFCDRFVLRQCTFHLRCGHQMARNVEHVVDAARYPQIAVVVSPSAWKNQYGDKKFYKSVLKRVYNNYHRR